MIISKVLSYKNAWHELLENHEQELHEILEALPEFIEEFLNTREEKNRPMYREIWDQKLSNRDWEILDRAFYLDGGQRVYVGNIGPVKNQVSASISFGHIDFLNRWLFQQTTLAGKYEISKIPILLIPDQDYGRRLEDRFFSRFSFEMYQRQIEPLTPLSHAYPFLILGYSDQEQLFEPEVMELETDPLVGEENIVIDRCIEFPPEYYQSGLNILNFFGTYIREQYPDEDAKVKIEQNGQLVRLIIETDDGEKEIVEKALEEYQLVVTGQKEPEEITQNQKLVLELRSELRLAKYRIETQQDIVKVQQGQMDQLFGIIGQGLVNKSQVNIDFKPTISLKNVNTINQDISYALSSLNDLKQLVAPSSSEYLTIEDLEGSLVAIESEQDKEVVKSSSAMNKLKSFIEKVSEGNEQISKAIKATEVGWETFKTLAGKYNSIAEWCGLPQVPTMFTK